MWTLLQGDCIEQLKTLPNGSANCCVTSPPYWGLRDYGCAGQLGLEPTPEEYVTRMVEVFREVRRVLRDDGTLWLNLGDCYAANRPMGQPVPTNTRNKVGHYGKSAIPGGLKPKDMVGIPWRMAFALQADGWYLRSDIIWHKPNPMPESVTDRPTKAHEYIFLLSKSERYHYDAEAIREPLTGSSISRLSQNTESQQGAERANGGTRIDRPMKAVCRSGNKERKINAPDRLNTHMGSSFPWEGNTRNKRTVWTVATKPYAEAHFATFPPELITPCILAGCPEGGIVLEPFAGSGTTLMVAEQLERNSIGIELNPAYCRLVEKRMAQVEPNLFAEATL